MRVAVVGAGTAGCLVAYRLRQAGHEVVVIEAGPSEVDPRSHSIDWLDVQAVESRRWPGLRVRRAGDAEPYLTGRGVGGSSAINGMVATLGPLADYDEWPVIDVGVALDRVGFEQRTVEADTGPLGAAVLASASGFATSPARLAMTGGPPDGLARRNLGAAGSMSDVLGESLVAQLVSNGHERVIGVALANGRVIDADHTIVCAGAIHTPGLLLGSGVGNEAVGVGLADHPSRVITFELDPAMRLPEGATASPITTIARRDGVDVLFMDHTGSDEPGHRTGAAIVVLMDPVSSGSVTLTSGEPTELDVRFNMLAQPGDADRLDDGIERAMAWLRDIDVISGADGFAIEPGFGPVSHASASCRVGSCLDSDGSVKGWEGISVMDASALPGIPRAHPMIPTLVVTEALSAEWLRRHSVGHDQPS